MSIPDTPRERTRRVQEILSEQNVDAMILSKGINQYYLSGFLTRPQKRHLLLIVPADSDPVFFIPEPYYHQVTSSSWVSDIRTWADDENPVTVLEETVADIGLESADEVLVNEEMWAMYALDLMDVIDAEFSLAEEVLMDLRMRKSESEIENIAEASQLADEVSEEVRAMDAVGMTENQLAAEIEYLLRQKGASDAFTQVASGPNSADPPHTGSDREIQADEPVILDFGCNIDGYLSDQSRVVVYEGSPPDGFVDAFDTVRDAQEAAVDTIEAGIEAREVDAVARSIIEDAGYEGKFLHVTGHGVGLGIHEPPYLMSGSYLQDGNEIELEPGMVVTVEPGIYLSDKWGIRVEDLVIVREDGCERLNSSHYGWEPL